MSLTHHEAEILSAARRWHDEMALVSMIANSAGRPAEPTTGLNDAMADLVAALVADAEIRKPMKNAN